MTHLIVVFAILRIRLKIGVYFTKRMLDNTFFVTKNLSRIASVG